MNKTFLIKMYYNYLREQMEKVKLEQKLKILETELAELQSEMNTSQEKQNELLSFTSKLTEKNTQLQSENASLNEKLEQVQTDLKRVNILMNELNASKKQEVKMLFRLHADAVLTIYKNKLIYLFHLKKITEIIIIKQF